MEVKYVLSSNWFWHELDGELFLIGDKEGFAYKAKRLKKDFILAFTKPKNKSEVYSNILSDQITLTEQDLDSLFSELLKNKVLTEI